LFKDYDLSTQTTTLTSPNIAKNSISEKRVQKVEVKNARSGREDCSCIGKCEDEDTIGGKGEFRSLAKNPKKSEVLQ
jgi:hypothetical protein